MQGRRRKRDTGGRRKSKEFMDAALDAYIRHLALEKWREVTDLQATLGMQMSQAVCEAGTFLERGAYRDIWERCWQRQVLTQVGLATGSIFGGIEAAVQQAVQEEIEARRGAGDVTVEDTRSYQTFVIRALDQLFEEEAGSIEEL
ncbi:hypothetical protein NKDENANG_02687 [Candidatus Entotheonellaceae bacterium PAL068K]